MLRYVPKKHFAHSKKKYAEHSLSLPSNGERLLNRLNTWSDITERLLVRASGAGRDGSARALVA